MSTTKTSRAVIGASGLLPPHLRHLSRIDNANPRHAATATPRKLYFRRRGA
jgi:hypothetical protein